MEMARPKRTPWKSWKDFTEWAQDFSLRKKVLGGLLAVVVLVGLVTSLIGTGLVRDKIIEQAQIRLFSDLATARFVLRTFQENVELKVRLIGGSERIKELLKRGDYAEVRNRLAVACVENDLDYLSIADAQGRMVVTAFRSHGEGSPKIQDPIISSALEGSSSSGLLLVTDTRLLQENPGLQQRMQADAENGTVIEAAFPLLIEESVDSVLYGGVLLNGNTLVVDRAATLLFDSGRQYHAYSGQVTLYQHERAVATTFRGREGLPRIGFKASQELKREVLGQGRTEILRESRQGAVYLSAAQPLRDTAGEIVGALQVATPEEPIISIADELLYAFLIIALLGVLLMAAISYFLVQWINRPLELMLNAARQAAEGDLSHEVPVVARDEVGELAATFNLMIRNLAESRKKLEEWGKELASKVAEQTGEIKKAREQVARVQKLASLEKMADGMAHIMAHISDPLHRATSAISEDEAEVGATNRVLVLESDERQLEVCRQPLEDEGFEVTATTSVSEALKALEQDLYDVVIADIDMPEMRGKQLLKEIKYRQPEILAILTAPFKATEEAVEAVKLGAYDYLPKPFGPHQILLMVYTALQTQQMVQVRRQEHASRRAETIFQRLPVAIALADDAHRVVYNNRSFVDLATQSGEDSVIIGKTFQELFGVDPLEKDKSEEEGAGSRWLELSKVGRTAKLYNFKLPEEDLRVLMLLDITDTVKKDQEAEVFRAETMARAQEVIHRQMRVAQEIAGLLGETTAETKAALFELISLAGEGGEGR